MRCRRQGEEFIYLSTGETKQGVSLECGESKKHTYKLRFLHGWLGRGRAELKEGTAYIEQVTTIQCLGAHTRRGEGD